MTRRWQVGEPFEVDGLRWRVVKGKKSPDDLRLEHLTPNGWRPTAMAMLFMLADFWYENEDLLYPKPRYQGADYLLREVTRAAKQGWQVAQAKLQKEKEQKRARERAPTLVLSAPVACPLIDCDNDPEWHCPQCGKHLASVYLPCDNHQESVSA